MTDGVFDPLLVIVALGLVTYLLRAGGYWFMGRVRPSRRVERALDALPGAIVVSAVLPVALRGGVSAILCIAIAVAMMVLTKRDVVAVAAAIAAAALARAASL